jgi:integrase
MTKPAISRKRKQPKLIDRDATGEIYKLPDGRYWLECRNPRQRFTRDTEQEVREKREEVAAARKQNFLPSAANATLNDVLNLVEPRNIRKGLGDSSRSRHQTNIKTLLRDHGHLKVTELVAQRMKPIQDWLDTAKSTRGLLYAKGSQDHFKSTLRTAFDLAIKARWTGPTNPADWIETGGAKRVPRLVLKLEQIDAAMVALSYPADGEHEVDYCSRRIAFLIGLLTGARNQETAALLWDSVNLITRTIFLRRKWEKGKGIVDTTKSGDTGKRGIPMSPMLYAEIKAYKERLENLGYSTAGNRPVIITAKSPNGLNSTEINSQFGYVKRKVHKAGIEFDFTYYNLRHTYLNLLLSIGVTIEQCKSHKLMGHKDFVTTAKYYDHNTRWFDEMPLQMRALNKRYDLGLDLNPRDGGAIESLYDGLGYLLAYRWINQGLPVNSGPKRPSPETFDPILISGPQQLALPAPDRIIDLTAAPATPEQPETEEERWSKKAAWAIAQRQAGRPLEQIAKTLQISTITLNAMLRDAGIHGLKLGRNRYQGDQLRALKDRQRELRIKGYDQDEIAKILGEPVRKIVRWGHEDGASFKHRRPSYRSEQYLTRILELKAEGKSDRDVAAQLQLENPNEKTPAHSTIGYLLTKKKATRLRRGGGIDVRNWEPQIRILAAADINKEQIAFHIEHELGGPSRTGIIDYIRRNNIPTIPGDRGKRIARPSQDSE